MGPREKVAVSPFRLDGLYQDIPESVVVYDSTLRDGEQMPGVAFVPAVKLEIARALDEVGVPEIEAGFPSVSVSEAAAVRQVAQAGLDADILCLARLRRDDIDAAADAGVDLVLLFVPASPIQLKVKLKKTVDEVLPDITRVTEYARDRGLRVGFSTEDSTRANLADLVRIYRAAVAAGAERVGITDTVGCSTPNGTAQLVQYVKRALGGFPVSVHLHNDFGLATANALAGVLAGAGFVTTTVNGIGERAGNVPLQPFVMAAELLYGIPTGVDPTGLQALSELVAARSGVAVHPNAPVAGSNVFSHESGIHVKAVMEDPRTYEPYPPELVGQRRTLALGKHTGEAHVKAVLSGQGVRLTEEQVDRVTASLKELGERQGAVTFAEFWEIVSRVTGQAHRVRSR
ncbi:MAG TPA: homoaconitate hydratase [Candidatus Thermoplasmatota archaeon]